MHRLLFLFGLVTVLACGASCRRPIAHSAASPPLSARATTSPAPLKIGDRVETVSFVDQSGRARTLPGPEAPRALLINFVFTRCSQAEFCPRLSAKFREVRQVLDGSPLADSVELVSVTLDPERDTPEVLAGYAGALKARPGSWSFARCEPGDLGRLRESFGVKIKRPDSDGTIEHNLITALIGADGRLGKVWEGNSWTTDSVMEAAALAVASAPLPMAKAGRIDPHQ